MEDSEVYIDIVADIANFMLFERKNGRMPESDCEFDGANYFEYLKGLKEDRPPTYPFNPFYFEYLSLRDGDILESYSGGVHVDAARQLVSACRELINTQPDNVIEQYVDDLTEYFSRVDVNVRVDDPALVYECKEVPKLCSSIKVKTNFPLMYAILAMQNIAKSVMADSMVWGGGEFYQFPYRDADAHRLFLVSEALSVARGYLSLCAVDQVVNAIALDRDRVNERAKNDGASGGDARSKKFGVLKDEAIDWILQEHRVAGYSLAVASRRYISGVYSQKDSIDKILKPDSDHVRTVRQWVSDHLKMTN